MIRILQLHFIYLSVVCNPTTKAVKYQLYNKMKKNLKIIIFLFTLFVLNSCSVATPFFIQNTTQNTIKLKIIYNYPIEDLSNYGNYKIVYQNGNLTPKQFEKSKELLDIEQQQISDSTLLITIPKNSTVRIASTSNTYFANKIKSIEYNDKVLTIDEVLKNSTSKHWKITYKIQ